MKLVKALAAASAAIEYVLIAVVIVLVAATALDVITFIQSGGSIAT